MDLLILWEWAKALWLLWLMLLFGLIVFWAYRPKNKKKFEDAARIPFREEEEKVRQDDGEK